MKAVAWVFVAFAALATLFQLTMFAIAVFAPQIVSPEPPPTYVFVLFPLYALLCGAFTVAGVWAARDL